MQTKDLAICLRTVNFSETSQVVTLLTREHGKIAAMAKGSRRAKSSFDGPIEIFSFGQVMFTLKETGGQLAILTDFQQPPRFRGLHANLRAMNAALFATELTEAFLEDHDPHSALFDKFIKFLETLQEAKDESVMLAWLILYQLRLLEEIGLEPLLDTCVNCSAPFSSGWKKVYFSSHSNGLLCPSCETAFVEKHAISAPHLAILQNPAKLPKTDRKKLHEIEQLLIYHFTELLGKPPRMAKYFT
ncbi:MAG: DNA repair protein RecO [Phycisphaerae bacterium]|nr:DNA repair protein RecO [Phycisphaerae bacterium]